MNKTYIDINNLKVRCLIGVWSHERTTPQDVRVDVSVAIDGRSAAESDALEATFNYAAIAEQITFILEEGQFKLLETACWMIQRCLLLATPSGGGKPIAESVSVRLSKFGVLPGEAVAVVRSELSHEELTVEREDKTWGSVDIIAESKDVGLYRLNLAPGSVLPTHVHKVMREAELVLHDGLQLRERNRDWRSLNAGDRFAWPHDHVHGYRNEGAEIASLLCIDSPTFKPSDEIITEVEP